MKTCILCLILFFSATFTNAATIQATTTGLWSSSTSWNLGRIPGNGDIIIIPSGITITISSTVTLSSTVLVEIFGTLIFSGGSTKLNLSSTSEVYVYTGGEITDASGSGSHLINIGSNQVYKGNQGNVVGPQYASSSTSNFQPFVPLAVKFLYFTIAQKSNSIVLQWSTVFEMNSYQFQVQRSTDGSTWSTIAYINASGASTEEKDYSFIDNNPPRQTVYYQIKEVDINGNISLTPVRSLEQNNVINKISIGTSASGTLHIIFTQPINSTITARLVSLTGQVAYQQILPNPTGQVTFYTSLKGCYIVWLSDGHDFKLTKEVVF